MPVILGLGSACGIRAVLLAWHTWCSSSRRITGARLPPTEAALITPRVIPPKPLGVLVSSASVCTSVRAEHAASQTMKDSVSSCVASA